MWALSHTGVCELGFVSSSALSFYMLFNDPLNISEAGALSLIVKQLR